MASLRNALSFGTSGDLLTTGNTGGSNGDAFTQVVAGTTLKWSTTQTYLGGAVAATANGAEGVRLPPAETLTSSVCTQFPVQRR